MQNPFGDPQRTGCQRIARADVDEAPAAEGSRDGQGAPVRVVEDTEREAEGRIPGPCRALGLLQQPAEARVEFHARTQQQEFALESGEVERLAQAVESRRREFVEVDW